MRTPQEIAAIKAFIKEHNIRVESTEDCAKATFHVCLDIRVSVLDSEGKCSICGKPIFFSDKFPEDGPQPPKVCLQCAVDAARGEVSFDA